MKELIKKGRFIMAKMIKLITSKEDYFKVVNIADRYSNRSGMGVYSKESSNEIIFKCSRLKLKKLKHDIILAIELGIDVKMEI